LCRALQIERQESFEDLFVGQAGGPGVGVADSRIQLLVRQVGPGGTEVVEGCEGAFLALGFGSEPGEW
jgi:hypothetical protein